MNLIKAEVVTIGDEILYGQIVDTNTQWISSELDKIGVKTNRKISIGDDESEILNMLSESLERVEIVIITGGLGPTKDDITKKTIAKFFNDHLVINTHAEAFVKDFFEKRGREFTEINRQQAALPSKCVYLPNITGTAPGMWFEDNNKILVSLPGVPHEMKYLMEAEVIPKLKSYFNTPVIVHKVIRTIGIGESFLAEKIANWEDSLPNHIKLAYLPNFGQVKLRLTGIGEKQELITADIEIEIKKLKVLINEYIYSFENEELQVVIGKMLRERNQTVAIAESCTGGYIQHLLTSISGSSDYFKGGVTSYANETKQHVLNVDANVISDFGAVSEQTVRQMSEGVRKLLNTDYGVATSGVAGPDGGTEEKPVGTIWIAVSSKEKTYAFKLLMTKQRETNIQYGSVVALNMLRKLINNTLV
jgi:nicotinamide-nucleotide amidase